MISVAEADRLLAEHTATAGLWPDEAVPLSTAHGRVLREDLRADRAYPAQDRSRMDGIAIAIAAWDMGVRAFSVTGLAAAGAPRARLDDAVGCVEIMTGGAVPDGADTVIRYEDLAIRDGIAHVDDAAVVRAGQNVHRRGSDCAAGDVLVPAGTRLHAARIAVAASVGAETVRVTRRPRIAIVTTGDELVRVGDVPEAHQLRGSNGPALAALFAPWADVTVTHSGDAPDALRRTLAAALERSDLLLASGGVSAGKFDLVPETLAALGVERVFHKVAQKPGKPLWFGGAGAGLPVFGLPGNPVSALVCARRYVLPYLWRRAGWNAPAGELVECIAPVTPSHLTLFVPVRRAPDAAGTGAFPRVDPRTVNGSGDFAGLAGSDGFIECAPAESRRQGGESFSFFPWLP